MCAPNENRVGLRVAGMFEEVVSCLLYMVVVEEELILWFCPVGCVRLVVPFGYSLYS